MSRVSGSGPVWWGNRGWAHHLLLPGFYHKALLTNREHRFIPEANKRFHNKAASGHPARKIHRSKHSQDEFYISNWSSWTNGETRIHIKRNNETISLTILTVLFWHQIKQIKSLFPWTLFSAHLKTRVTLNRFSHKLKLVRLCCPTLSESLMLPKASGSKTALTSQRQQWTHRRTRTPPVTHTHTLFLWTRGFSTAG